MPLRRNALPYDIIAGVEPCPGGWLVVSARLVATTVSFEPPQVLPTFIDLIDYRPSFRIIAIHAPLAMLEKAEPRGRVCDREARKLLGGRRATAIVTPPSRQALADETAEPLAAVAKRLLPKYREVAEEMQPYRTRQLFEVNPETSFHQLNGNQSLRYPKWSAEGLKERLALLADKFYDIDMVMSAGLPKVRAHHLLDAAADLWTARRVAARAVIRLPQDPMYDEQGLVMQILR